MLVAIDPSIANCSVAVFTSGALSRATTIQQRAASVDPAKRVQTMVESVVTWIESSDYPIVRDIVYEWPRVYTHDKQHGKDPNDLLGLTAVGAGIAAILDANVRSVYPNEWKGQLKKHQTYQRISKRLSKAEFAHVPLNVDHNCWDAIGIGLYVLGRFDACRIFPGASDG